MCRPCWYRPNMPVGSCARLCAVAARIPSRPGDPGPRFRDLTIAQATCGPEPRTNQHKHARWRLLTPQYERWHPLTPASLPGGNCKSLSANRLRYRLSRMSRMSSPPGCSLRAVSLPGPFADPAIGTVGPNDPTPAIPTTGRAWAARQRSVRRSSASKTRSSLCIIVRMIIEDFVATNRGAAAQDAHPWRPRTRSPQGLSV